MSPADRDQGRRAADLLMSPPVQERLLASARQTIPHHVHGITADDVVQEAVCYVWSRAERDPESFAAKSDEQIVGLAYQRIFSYSIDQIRRRKTGLAKIALVAGYQQDMSDNPIDQLVEELSGQVNTFQDLMAELYPLVERLFDTTTGLNRFITKLRNTVGDSLSDLSPDDLDSDPAMVKERVLKLLATAVSAERLAPAAKAKPPIKRRNLLRLEGMLTRREPITEASTGLRISDIVRGLDHIWRASAAIVDQPAPTTPAKALVLAGVTPSLDVARQLLDTYTSSGGDIEPQAAFDELDAIVNQNMAAAQRP
jgi:hypothetical protein